MVLSCNISVGLSEITNGMLRRPKVVPFKNQFLYRDQRKPKYDPKNPRHKLLNVQVAKNLTKTAWGAQALRMSFENLKEMLRDHVVRTAAEVEAAAAAATTKARAATEAAVESPDWDDEPQEYCAPLLIFPKSIQDATEAYCNEKVSIKTFMKDCLEISEPRLDKDGFSMPPTHSVGKNAMFLRFFEWARDHATGDDSLRNWNQDMLDNALLSEGVIYTKDGPSKNERKIAYWNVAFRRSQREREEMEFSAKRFRPYSDDEDHLI